MPNRTVKRALTQTQKRKKEHLELCLDTESVSSPSSTGLEAYRFIHNALPELDIDGIDISTTFLGKRLSAPVLISSMTGGFDAKGALAAEVEGDPGQVWKDVRRTVEERIRQFVRDIRRGAFPVASRDQGRSGRSPLCGQGWPAPRPPGRWRLRPSRT